jgi:phage terminase large subunit-like protein
MERVWDMAMFGLRLGDDPRVMVSTTPKPIALIREMVDRAQGPDADFVLTKGTSYENRENLAADFFSAITRKYEGTRLGRQELMAEILDEVEGALWTRAMVDDARVDKAPDLKRIVVAVDPAVTSGATSNLTGIVVAGLGADNKGYVLRDASGKYSPGEWANKALRQYDEFKADRIVAEGNQGGEMVRHTIQSARPNAPVTTVHASRSKQARAEPVAALYEQRRVKHVGAFPELEDQLCTWEPLSGQPSPDRLDALVWALTELMLDQAPAVPIVVPFVHFNPSSLPY